MTGAWDKARPTEGAYSALLNFENGVFASLTYSGYAHFDSDEFMGWIAESGYLKNPESYGAARGFLRQARSSDEEVTLKTARNYGGVDAPGEPLGRRWHQQFGMLIASCERADLRPLPNGIAIYGDESRRFEPLPEPESHRKEVIDEFYEAAVHGCPALHNGEWGLATMEVCLAILKSAREQREIFLHLDRGCLP
jgi:phthalate 4,5-cis-dihydrodiol dehydrogenase